MTIYLFLVYDYTINHKTYTLPYKHNPLDEILTERLTKSTISVTVARDANKKKVDEWKKQAEQPKGKQN